MSASDIFEVTVEPIDVTQLHRPDVGWCFIDAAGHIHEWHILGQLIAATRYNPNEQYEVPSLIWVKDGEEFWEGDDTPHDIGHHECRRCGEHLEPRFTADTHRQYVAGPKRFLINGHPVTPDEFEHRLRAASERTKEMK